MSDQTPIQQQPTQQQTPSTTPASTSTMFGGNGSFDPATLDATPLSDDIDDKEEVEETVERKEEAEISEENEMIDKPNAPMAAPVSNINTVSASEISAFLALIEQTKELLNISDKEEFTLIGQRTPDKTVQYQVSLFDEDEDDPTVVELFIKKIISTIATQEEDEHLLQFVYEKNDKTLEILVDEESLYVLPPTNGEKISDSVLIKEKIDKFSLLTTDLLSKLKREKEEVQKAQQKQHQLQEVFRNF